MDGTQVLDYDTTLPPYVLLGFTGATGGFNDVHQIQNVAITAGPPPPPPTDQPGEPKLRAEHWRHHGHAHRQRADEHVCASSSVARPPSTFSVENDTTVVATAPAGSLGTVDVTATTAGARPPPARPTSTRTRRHRCRRSTNVSPASGPSTGGTVVTITGTGLTGASSVLFGTGNPALFYTVNSPTSITATVPGRIRSARSTSPVTTPGGTSAAVSADKYTYTTPPAPVVSSVSPASGPNGTFVTITGTSFAGATVGEFRRRPRRRLSR